MKNEIYLIQICNESSILKQKFVVGRENAESVYNASNPRDGQHVTMNKTEVALNGVLVIGEYVKHKYF